MEKLPEPVPSARVLLAAVLPDIVAIVVFGVLARAELVDAKVATGLMLTVLTARLWRPPPRDGGGGSPPPPAGVATLAVGLLMLLARLRGAASTPSLESYS